MLKGIPRIIPPELLKVLAEMGHGDEMILADANFPAASVAQRLVRCDGSDGPALLDAILGLFPLDTFVQRPVALMAVVPGDDYQPHIWDEYRAVIARHEPACADFELIERFAFYERAKAAYAIVASGETARYANIILKKGIIGD